MPSVSRFIATELFVGLEIDHCPAVRLLEGEIDHTFDEQAVMVAPRDRHFTTASALLRGMARVIQKRMRQRGVRTFRGGSDLFCRRAQYAAVNGCEMLDRGQIAIQRDARKNGVDERAETRARPAGSPRVAARRFPQAEASSPATASPAIFAACVTVRTATEALLPAAMAC